jgi:hypothetical protein
MRKKRQGLTTELFIHKAKNIHGNKYNYSLVNYINNKTKIKIICPEHGEFEQEPRNHLFGKGCIKCGLNFTSKEKFLEKAKEIHGDKYDYSLINYKNISTNINIICPMHGEFEQSPNIHISKKSGCPKCYGNKKLTNHEIIEKFSKVHGTKYDYSLVEYKNLRTKIKIICPEHGKFEQSPNIHKNHGCPLCAKIYTENFIQNAKIVHNNKYDYSLVDYINAKKEVNIICPKHGTFKQIPNNHLSGKGCPRCNESKGELMINNILQNNNITYTTQKTFKGCKYIKLLRFDFFIEYFNLCIEYDGEQHFRIWRNFEKDDEKLKIRIIKDNIKNDFCSKNNINLLRIKYTDNIEEKLINYLKKINI